MRPPRIAILVLFLTSSIFLFCRAVSSIGRSASDPVITSPTANPQSSNFRSFFSFSAPFTLFPPNAIITLADDNSTSFAARPAAFGPLFPSRGLRGQLWIGSGFAEESLQAGEGEGELGCSDVPGWDDGRSSNTIQTPSKIPTKNSKSSTAAGKTKSTKRTESTKGAKGDRSNAVDSVSSSKNRPVDDGTDDYLHQGVRQSRKSNKDLSGEPSHADIQSIQETAEITGKIVLLSRGGCGFLEKVKWAQRRGAVALIVGDNQRGGPLIQMFARGDTSNVTIPSIFTSRTTAHLLSSLMQPGSFIEDIIDEHGKPALKVQPSANARRNRAKQTTTTTTTNAPIATPAKSSKFKTIKKTTVVEKTDSAPGNVSWLRRLFSWGSAVNAADEKSRPPSSGQLDWVLVDDFTDEKDKVIKNGLEKAKDESYSRSKKQPGSDDFQIGVHDWRDPDLLGSSEEDNQSQTASKDSATQAKSSAKSSGKKGDPNGPSGGSITPGSGEYVAGSVPATSKTSTSGTSNSEGNTASQGGLISKIFGEDDGADFTQAQSPPKAVNTPIVEQAAADDKDTEGHDGLWVVITPSGRATAWVDTLLVLVISPLITLTFVYTLLIIRARIRRRRWRAPKSVVERLPVRTYHTVVSTPARSPRIPSPSPPSPTTPLLQHQHNTARSRPRSQTTTGVASDLLQVNSALSGPRSPSHEKPHFSSEWKKYMTRQVECVVCLEEYVDGVSQVMSLPCGHEFHVECITPWLTTRRRTCPICKGDVVRSIARDSPSSPRYEPYQDESEEDHTQEAEASGSSPTRRADDNDSSSDSDVERGILSPAPRRPRRSRQDVWLSMLSRPF